MRTEWYNSVFEIDLDVIRDAIRATREFVNVTRSSGMVGGGCSVT